LSTQLSDQVRSRFDHGEILVAVVLRVRSVAWRDASVSEHAKHRVSGLDGRRPQTPAR
jgi:hypothetical protein